ncbi:hypothetical protein RRG08_038264 [Elysia crispata]|uniref:Uncharacterized protein n=1 Tax=Elysia crispata TaxID=231223 RepID=A0AAE1AN73_9GAST|nr:hypothetical protein RRG08_038264 [Elysia crispata]
MTPLGQRKLAHHSRHGESGPADDDGQGCDMRSRRHARSVQLCVSRSGNHRPGAAWGESWSLAAALIRLSDAFQESLALAPFKMLARTVRFEQTDLLDRHNTPGNTSFSLTIKMGGREEAQVNLSGQMTK